MPSFPCTRVPSLILIATLWVAAGDVSAQRGDRGSTAAAMAERAARTEQRAHDVTAQSRHHDRTAEQRALSAAVRRVESQTGGQVLSAERVPFDGRDVSRIKVVDSNGRVRVYMDDPFLPRDRRLRAQDVVPTRDDDN